MSASVCVLGFREAAEIRGSFKAGELRVNADPAFKAG